MEENMSASVQKVVLITGGSAGLGARCAQIFAPDFRVVINYANNTERATTLLTNLSQIPCTHPTPTTPRFHSIRADISQRASIDSLISETISTMGRLDIVISNAGWTRPTNFMDLNDNCEEEDWEHAFRVNVMAHLLLARAAKPYLEEVEGAFVTTASAAGVKPGGSSIAYAVTKAAQIYLVKTLATVCAPKIRCNSVSPGMLLTDWGLSFPESKRKAAVEKTKLKRLATVDDVAMQIRTLALSQSMTGQNVIIEGGSTL